MYALLPRQPHSPRQQRFPHVIGVGQIQHGIAQEDHEFLVFSFKRAGQGTVVCLGDNAFPHPLPKLSLRSPKLLPIAADYQRSLLLFLFLLVFIGAHLF